MAVPFVPEASGDHAQKVANHYNQLEEAGKSQRTLSRIYYLRNFNNWIKSALIRETLETLYEKDRHLKIHALDLCSGKGGDLLKWKKGRIHHLICADIAATSVEQSESRYRQSSQREHNLFTAQFIVADCTKTRLKDKYEKPDQKFDIVSCQFSFHYCFESYSQAMTMLRNACECLKPGGYFIGTTPNSNEIIHRLRNSQGNSFGNEVYNISFQHGERKQFPLFGATYNFHLEGVVDCPEFLVYFPALEKMAAEFGMKLVEKKTFAEYFKQNVKKKDYVNLLQNMQALEPYPASRDRPLVSSKAEDYITAEKFWSRVKESQKQNPPQHQKDDADVPSYIGTLSKAEWEAATIYSVFVFQKVEDIAPPLFSFSSTSNQDARSSDSASDLKSS